MHVTTLTNTCYYLAHGRDEEEEEEDHPNKIVHHCQEAGECALVDRIG